MSIPPLRLSRHARHRIHEFKLFPSEVVAMVYAAEVTRPARQDKMAICGPWAVVYNPDAGIIITVLRHAQEHWDHDNKEVISDGE